jgi:hypothetical protein
MENIAKAFVALQADLVPVEKNGKNPFFNSDYIELPDVMLMIQPLLAKHKLGVMQPTTNIDGVSAIKTIIVHESGEMLEFEPMPLLLTKQDPQAQGSAITYARRYSLCSVLGIVADKDDDGNKASAPKTQKTELPPATPTDKQKKYINDLLVGHDIKPNEMVGHVKEVYDIDLKNMTMANAKFLIDQLSGEVK